MKEVRLYEVRHPHGELLLTTTRQDEAISYAQKWHSDTNEICTIDELTIKPKDWTR